MGSFLSRELQPLHWKCMDQGRLGPELQLEAYHLLWGDLQHPKISSGMQPSYTMHRDLHWIGPQSYPASSSSFMKRKIPFFQNFSEEIQRQPKDTPKPWDVLLVPHPNFLPLPLKMQIVQLGSTLGQISGAAVLPSIRKAKERWEKHQTLKNFVDITD